MCYQKLCMFFLTHSVYEVENDSRIVQPYRSGNDDRSHRMQLSGPTSVITTFRLICMSRQSSATGEPTQTWHHRGEPPDLIEREPPAKIATFPEFRRCFSTSPELIQKKSFLPSPPLSERGRYYDARCHAICVSADAALRIACNLLTFKRPFARHILVSAAKVMRCIQSISLVFQAKSS